MPLDETLTELNKVFDIEKVYLKNNGDPSFKIKPISCMVAMATYTRAEWWNWTFLNGKFLERKVKKQKLQTWSRFEVMLWFWWGGHNVPPGLDRVFLLKTNLILPLLVIECPVLFQISAAAGALVKCLWYWYAESVGKYSEQGHCIHDRRSS